jgi:predicted Fe-Mo cluster-binding NifX family protein
MEAHLNEKHEIVRQEFIIGVYESVEETIEQLTEMFAHSENHGIELQPIDELEAELRKRKGVMYHTVKDHSVEAIIIQGIGF